MLSNSSPYSGCITAMDGQLDSWEAANLKFETFLDLLPHTERIALRAADDRLPLTYRRLVEFSCTLDLACFGIGIRGLGGTAKKLDCLCALVSDGPEAVVCYVAMSQYCSYAPVNPKLSAAEMQFELLDLQARAAVVPCNVGAQGEYDRMLAVVRRTGIPVLQLTPSDEMVGLFSLKWDPASPLQLPPLPHRKRSCRLDVALMLHTSGTTKKPKIVPLTHGNLATGALCLQSTLRLLPDDLNMNVMPLFHIHGLQVNVLASLVAGSSILAAAGFDVDDIFQLLASKVASPTWYSAVPTMHQLICERGEEIVKWRGVISHQLCLIRNCSAALPVWLSTRMGEMFQTMVMPTYAMTESMPICSNPRCNRSAQDAACKLGSVGFASGPRVRVFSEHGLPLPMEQEGEVCVAGACVMKGYELREHMGQSNDPNVEAFHALSDGMWLRTGDKGFVDCDGHLTLVGRYKEIINRGGENISPLAIEEVLQQHPACKQLMAFAMPHELLGEVVGIAVVLKPGYTLTLREVREFGVQHGQSEKWLPETLIFMSEIPRGPTGKNSRINFAGPEKCLYKLPPAGSSDNATVVWHVDASGNIKPNMKEEVVDGDREEHSLLTIVLCCGIIILVFLMPPEKPLGSIADFLGGTASVTKPDPACWQGPFNYQACCVDKTVYCWDAEYTPARCCGSSFNNEHQELNNIFDFWELVQKLVRRVVRPEIMVCTPAVFASLHYLLQRGAVLSGESERSRSMQRPLDVHDSLATARVRLAFGQQVNPAVSALRVLATVGIMAFHYTAWSHNIRSLFVLGNDFIFVLATYLAATGPLASKSLGSALSSHAAHCISISAAFLLRYVCRTLPTVVVCAALSGDHVRFLRYLSTWPLGMEYLCLVFMQAIIRLSVLMNEQVGLAAAACLLALCLQKTCPERITDAKWHHLHKDLELHRLPMCLATYMATRISYRVLQQGRLVVLQKKIGRTFSCFTLWLVAFIFILGTAYLELCFSQGQGICNRPPGWLYPFAAKLPLVIGCVAILEWSRCCACTSGARSDLMAQIFAIVERQSFSILILQGSYKRMLVQFIAGVGKDQYSPVSKMLYQLPSDIFWLVLLAYILSWLQEPYTLALSRIVTIAEERVKRGLIPWLYAHILILSATCYTIWVLHSSCVIHLQSPFFSPDVSVLCPIVVNPWRYAWWGA